MVQFDRVDLRFRRLIQRLKHIVDLVDGAATRCNDQTVGVGMRGQMTLFLHQGAQYRNHLYSRNMLDRNDLNFNNIIRGIRAHTLTKGSVFPLAAGWKDLNQSALINGDKTVCFQNCQEGRIELLTIDGFRRDYRQVALDARIDQKVPAGHLGNHFSNLADISILEVDGDQFLRQRHPRRHCGKQDYTQQYEKSTHQSITPLQRSNHALCRRAQFSCLSYYPKPETPSHRLTARVP